MIGATWAKPSPDFGTEHDHDHDHDHDEKPNADESTPAVPEKQCELVRSSQATSPECFLEPECNNVCQQDTKQVGIQHLYNKTRHS